MCGNSVTVVCTDQERRGNRESEADRSHGEFCVLPAHVEMMYAPEVSGRADGGVFVVVDDKRLDAADMPSANG
jgi:hypothetical protein